MVYENSLYHHGILGQKWGVRRFQNKDGSLTNAGEKRYSKDNKKKTKKEIRRKKAEEQKRKAAKAYAKDPFLREHITWDKNGNIIKISKDLEKALDAPLSDIDDEDLVIMVAQELAERKSVSHHGILGQKWGVRRFQNPDGSLTKEGKQRYRDLVTEQGDYTDKALNEGFDKKVEKGVQNYVMGKKVKDPFVNQVIADNKSYIDSLIAQEHERQHQMMQQNQINQQNQWFMDEQARINRQQASLALSGGMNPFMFG